MHDCASDSGEPSADPCGRFAQTTSLERMLDAAVCVRALGARDARFDGLFFVGITSTRVYCRPVCPARVSYPDRRRFFESPAAAESAGFRPCLRCRPELAPGRAIIDAVPRLAHVAAHRIEAGALNDRTVADLAHDLGVSERHLRRALEREIGVSPLELAQTHRLLLAKRLLADTTLSVTRIAYASGFQSLRRFNAVFRERYRMSPTALRGTRTRDGSRVSRRESDEATAPLRLTLAYREPLAWNALLDVLRRDAIPGVELVDGDRYRRTVRIGAHAGIVMVERSDGGPPRRRRLAHPCLTVHISPALLPALMPLLARLRHLFDLDAEPAVIDAHLAQGGLAELVRRTPGMRLVGAFDGFETALALLSRSASASDSAVDPMRRIVEALGEPLECEDENLTRTSPSAETIARNGAAAIEALGPPNALATIIHRAATMVADGTLRLDPGSDVERARSVLASIDGLDSSLAERIVMRTLRWPDGFPMPDDALVRATGVGTARHVVEWAEQWRPWRAYAMMHLMAPGTS